MALFRYEALNERGKKISGALDAESLSDAKQKLFKQSIFLTRIEPLSHAPSKSLLKKGEVLNLTRELARLLRAGLPLYESLYAMEEKYRGQKAQRLFLDLCEQVKAGRSFSAALARHPKTFDLLYVAMIANAETTGRLGPALEELSVLLSKQQHVRKQLINALLYPTLLFGFCLFVFGSLLFYVVPSLEELFEGRELHPFTQIVFSISHVACRSKFFLASLPVAGIGLGFAIALLPKWKEKCQTYFLRLPLLNRLFAKVALIRFCRASATLLEGGVPIVAAFSQARTTMRHLILEEVVRHAEQVIAQGEPIHAPFTGHPLIPPLVPRMLGIAEEGGNLPSMMRQIAEIYEEDLEQALARFSTVAQPALLLFLGAIVGFVLLSVLLPITDVGSFAN
ncbi:MAG: type II secretion system F family protein [Verrucomicrobiota bacterium]|nr:type II secretion system F family protein [Verrucomicrobiota bacterium]